ncbi:MAG: hypothetical protein H7Y38_04535 [Armatimonadetes bacterium]|nr:hypothetical protein [Armatimonadota bacterium]
MATAKRSLISPTKSQWLVISLFVSVIAFALTEWSRTILFSWKSFEFGRKYTNITDVSVSGRGNFLAAVGGRQSLTPHGEVTTHTVWLNIWDLETGGNVANGYKQARASSLQTYPFGRMHFSADEWSVIFDGYRAQTEYVPCVRQADICNQYWISHMRHKESLPIRMPQSVGTPMIRNENGTTFLLNGSAGWKRRLFPQPELGTVRVFRTQSGDFVAGAVRNRVYVWRVPVK